MFRSDIAKRGVLTEVWDMELNTRHFDYRRSLAEELRVRQVRNPRYSLRSFARDLGVSVTALSDVLSGKRHFSKRNALQVMDRLGWAPLERASVFVSISSVSQPQRQTSSLSLRLADDQFRVIADWYYLVILNLAQIEGAKSAPAWICQRTGISSQEAREAIKRLKRLGYISTKNGELRRLAPNVETTTEVPSAAIRKYHRQNFKLAEEAQEHVPFERRQISSFTVATDPSRVLKAKKCWRILWTSWRMYWNPPLPQKSIRFPLSCSPLVHRR